MDINQITAGEILVVLVIVVFAALFFIKHLITFSYQKQIEAKTKEAELIQSHIEKVVLDFKAQVETLKNDIKHISIGFSAYKDATSKIIDKLEDKTDANKSKQDQLIGKLDFIEKHNAELDKKIEEKVKLVFLDVSKVRG